jgi:hypothetical protein
MLKQVLDEKLKKGLCSLEVARAIAQMHGTEIAQKLKIEGLQ